MTVTDAKCVMFLVAGELCEAMPPWIAVVSAWIVRG